MKIGLISDTHGWIHPRLYEHFRNVDEIWHAGDIGDLLTVEKLKEFKPLIAVSGNIDNSYIRDLYPAHQRFKADNVRVWITHIGGVPGHYEKSLLQQMGKMPPDLFICGHSHIARIQYDRKRKFLFINPGAAGYIGFHKTMTAIRFNIDGFDIHDLELIDMGERRRTA